MRTFGNFSGRKSRSHMGQSSGSVFGAQLLQESYACPPSPVIATKLCLVSVFPLACLIHTTHSAMIGDVGQLSGVRV